MPDFFRVSITIKMKSDALKVVQVDRISKETLRMQQKKFSWKSKEFCFLFIRRFFSHLLEQATNLFHLSQQQLLALQTNHTVNKKRKRAKQEEQFNCYGSQKSTYKFMRQ